MLAIEGEDQIMLRVSVAEVSREILKQFGINLGALINQGSFTTSVLTDNALPLTAAAGIGALPVAAIPTTGSAAGLLGLATATPAPGPGNPFGNSGVQGFWQSGDGSKTVAYALRALERDGLIKTLAEPNLTAVSGEAAKFLAGGEFPILIPGSGAVAELVGIS